MKYMYTCNAMMSWMSLKATTESAAKREASKLAKGYGATAGVVRIGISRPAQQLQTVARKGAHFGQKWQAVNE